MIQIEVLETFDYDSLGSRTLFKNEIFIGHNRGDILVKDRDIIDFHLRITVEENKAYAAINPDLKQYLVNGKIAQGKSSIKAGDKIKIGNSLFLISALVFEPQKTFKQESNEKLETLISEKSPILEILKVLENEL